MIKETLAELVAFIRALFPLLTLFKLHHSWKAEAWKDKSS